jgi:tetratricopeptide (TPR) repeat protein
VRKLLLVLILPLLAAADLVTAQRLLVSGQYRAATQEFRGVIDEHPEHPGAWVGLARARAGLGDCDRTVEILSQWRHAGAYNARAALAEGWCWYRLGEMSQAQETALDVIRLKPNLGPGWYLLALASQALGDEVGWETAIEGLDVLERGDVMIALAEGWRAMEEGDEEALALASRELEELAKANPRSAIQAQIAMLDAQRWLDLGDPVRAEDALHDVTGQDDEQVRALLLRAEAIRRQGNSIRASRYLQSPSVRARTSPIPRAVRLRTLVDMGVLDVPRERLPELIASPHPEDVATGWYVARALGDEALTARFAAEWARVNTNPDRSLEQLIPVGPLDEVSP